MLGNGSLNVIKLANAQKNQEMGPKISLNFVYASIPKLFGKSSWINKAFKFEF